MKKELRITVGSANEYRSDSLLSDGEQVRARPQRAGRWAATKADVERAGTASSIYVSAIESEVPRPSRVKEEFGTQASLLVQGVARRSRARPWDRRSQPFVDLVCEEAVH